MKLCLPFLIFGTVAVALCHCANGQGFGYPISPQQRALSENENPSRQRAKAGESQRSSESLPTMSQQRRRELRIERLPPLEAAWVQPVPIRRRSEQFRNGSSFEHRATFEEPVIDSYPEDYFFRPPPSSELPNRSLTIPPLFVVPANQSWNGDQLLAPYRPRSDFRQRPEIGKLAAQLAFPEIPVDFEGWWVRQVIAPAGLTDGHIDVSINTLIQSALVNSPHIQVAAVNPHIQKSVLMEESTQFDWHAFLATKYDDQNDPIGNSLTTGNTDTRFKQQEWSSRSGVRRKNAVGGEFEMSQRLGHLDNNSNFLVPPDQGSSRIELNYRQPILNGRGRAVNESLIVLADIDFHSASDEFLQEVQDHLVSVTEAYWELVRARAEFLQRQKLLRGAKQILDNLSGRAEVDALNRQILRARSAVANRQAEIARSFTSIKNAESRLRLLVGDPAMGSSSRSEFVPTELPQTGALSVELADAISTALVHRPDISKAIREFRAANVRLGVAKNEVLPKLDLLIGTYIAGLDGESDIFESWVRQFKDGRPGFNVGIEFEVPLGNRASHFREQKRQWELARAQSELREIVETALTEVEIAVREIATAHKELDGRYLAMLAAADETGYLFDRWQTLPGVDDSVTLLMEDLLDSQERLAIEEATFVRAQTNYSMAAVKLKHAMGTLFLVENQ